MLSNIFKNKLNKETIMRFLVDNWIVIAIVSFFFVLHLAKITMPPIDDHNWRQVDTAAVARNFQNESTNILQPRVDIRGYHSGITGMEFPFYNYVLFIFNTAFGYQHWHGRVLTLVFACIAIGFYYALISRRYSKVIANFSVGVLAFMPLFFNFAKSIQPDIMMVMFGIITLYYTQKYSEKLNNISFYLAAIFLSITMLIKIPAVFIILPMALLLGKKGIKSIFVKDKILFLTLVVFLPVVGWYLYSDFLSKHYGLGSYFYGDISIAKSLALSATKGFWNTIRGYILPVSFPLGMIYIIIFIGFMATMAKKDYFPASWAAAFLTFIGLFSIKSFYHNYYSLPLIPPIALFIGIALEWIYKNLKKENKKIALLFVIIISAFAGYYTLKTFRSYSQPKLPYSYLNLENIANNNIGKNDLIITNFDNNPVILYFSNRKGWSLGEFMYSNKIISGYKDVGAKYLLLDKRNLATDKIEYLNQYYEKKYMDSDFIIFSL